MWKLFRIGSGELRKTPHLCKPRKGGAPGTICNTKQYAAGDIHTNTVKSAFSLLKRGMVGTWHKVSAKHLPAYLDEMCFRLNNRKNPYLFRDSGTKLIQMPNDEYKELTAQQAEPAA